MAADANFEGTLARVALRTASSLDVADVLREITRGLVQDLGAALARIWLLRPEEPDVLLLAASAGLSERLDGSRSRVLVGTLKIGRIAEARAPLCTSELESDDFADHAWIREHGLRGFAGYPLVYRGELLGVLAMFARTPLGEAELEPLAVFAAQAAVALKNAALFAEVEALMRRLEAENAYLKEELGAARPRGIVGESAALGEVLAQLDRAAKTTSTVLLVGETGTGKELFARAVHEASPRQDGPLVKVNCAALAPSLVESELFGHEKGAFTGAVARRLGRFELAHGGTLFLDEVSELPLEAQAKLLRAIQEREIERVGGGAPVAVDVRLVAATNRDLAAEVKAGRFRADLYFRLNVVPLRIPPLRERREDIPALARAFLARLSARLGVPAKTIDEDTLAYLEAYDWPGNVRELENVLERAAVLAHGPRIEVSDLPELAAATITSAETATQGTLKERVSAFERELLADAMRRAGGNQSEAARLLGTSRATLQYRLRLLGV